MSPARWSRRRFLTGSAATAGVLASPWRSFALPLDPAALMDAATSTAAAPAEAAVVLAPSPTARPIPLLRSTVARPLRYALQEGGYRIVNGRERFNRPLYTAGGGGSVLHAGDLPELRLTLPNATAHLRLAAASRGSVSPRPLSEVAEITAHSVAGRLLYTLRDPDLLGRHGELSIETLTTADTPGIHVVLSGHSLPPGLQIFSALRLACAPPPPVPPPTEELRLGSATTPGRSDPALCAGITYALANPEVTAHTPAGEITIVLPSAATVHLADAAGWDGPWEALSVAPPALTPTSPQLLVVSVQANAQGDLPSQHLELGLSSVPTGTARENGGTPASSAATPTATTAAAPTPADRLARRRIELAALTTRVRIRTPEPAFDTVIAQLNLAADALWSPVAKSLIASPGDPTPSPAWSAPPGLDALGLHDHVRRHLEHWAALQNTSPLPPGTEPDGPVAAPPDSGTGLARKASMLDANGSFGPADRDTSLALLESMVRHLRWTGDLEFAKKLWPAIQRGLDRQYRLFRREVPDPESHYLLKPKLPAPALALYESYGSLSATDAIAYNGAGTTHATARNLFLNREAAVLARVLGQEAVAYDSEAALLDRSLRTLLWQPQRGCFAESLDTLLPQTLVADPGVWTAARVIDSECASPRESWQIVAERLAAQTPIPVIGPGLPDAPAPPQPAPNPLNGSHPGSSAATPPAPFLLSSSTWLGHTDPSAPAAGIASLHFAESARMALALWQAGDPASAFALLQGCLLDSTARGLVPGNLHRTSALDPILGETGIDHPDSVAAVARALVEGLFGVLPDLLRANLTLRPGFPSSWTEAELHHPDLDLVWTRKDLVERFTVTSHLLQPASLTLQLSARATGDPTVLLNGKAVPAHFDPNSTGVPRLIVEDLPPAPTWTVEVRWRGKPPLPIPARATLLTGEPVPLPRGLTPDKLDDPQICLAAGTAAEPGNHAVFARVVEGNCGYWLPIPLEIVSTSVTTSAEVDFPEAVAALETGTAVAPARTGTSAPPSGAFNDTPTETPPPSGAPGPVSGTRVSTLPDPSAAPSHSELTPTAQHFEPLLSNAIFDGFLTEILTRSYRTPRSPLCSLAVPEHLRGDPFAPAGPLSVSDRALRSAPRGTLRAFGIPFSTPTPDNAPNCRFVSSWTGDRDAFELSLRGRASALHLLIAAVSPPLAAGAPLGLARVRYHDGTEAHLPLSAAQGLWPIDRDLLLDDFVFTTPAGSKLVRRVDLATGGTRTVDPRNFASEGRSTPTGAACVLSLPLSPERDLAAFHIETSRYGAVLALLGATLARTAT